jgi:L-threonylcarbamoyladenylate synthase
MDPKNLETVIGTDLEKVIALLLEDQVVAIPTETVYGLAGHALKPEVIRKIYEIKQRPGHNPLILHTLNVSTAQRFVREWPEWAEKLAAAFWPGPLTLLLPKSDVVPSELTSGSDRVAIRVPAHALTRTLLERLPFPLAAPSANPFTYISPTTAEHVYRQLAGKIPYILDGGPCAKGLESTIVGMQGSVPVVYRSGAVSLEALRRILSHIQTATMEHHADQPVAPGMMKKHYSPRTPLILCKNLKEEATKFPERKLGFLVFGSGTGLENLGMVQQLSLAGDPDEAATGLYAALHTLDDAGLDLILAELLPEKGLGLAINDRLRRAAENG